MNTPPEAVSAFDMPERSLEEGGELRVGGTVFRVSVTEEDWCAGERKHRKDGSAVR